MPALQSNLVGHGPIPISVSDLMIAGWTDRDKGMVEHQMVELDVFDMDLFDPVRKSSLRLTYSIEALPVED